MVSAETVDTFQERVGHCYAQTLHKFKFEVLVKWIEVAGETVMEFWLRHWVGRVVSHAITQV